MTPSNVKTVKCDKYINNQNIIMNILAKFYLLKLSKVPKGQKLLNQYSKKFIQ